MNSQILPIKSLSFLKVKVKQARCITVHLRLIIKGQIRIKSRIWARLMLRVDQVPISIRHRNLSRQSIRDYTSSSLTPKLITLWWDLTNRPSFRWRPKHRHSQRRKCQELHQERTHSQQHRHNVLKTARSCTLRRRQIHCIHKSPIRKDHPRPMNSSIITGRAAKSRRLK